MRDVWQRWKVKWTPEAFQGWGKTRKYFEGWYFKLLSRDEDMAIAVIPGIAFDEDGEGHAFIQVLDGRANTSEYHKFDYLAFKPSKRRFELELGDNFFSTTEIRLNLPDLSQAQTSTPIAELPTSLSGHLQLSGRIPWPVKALSPGIMGWYAFVPFMECYHGIVSMDSSIHGELTYRQRVVSFDQGRAYLEKDWGRSFPSSWIWMQSNHFEKRGISFKASVARIPWVGQAFVGFIAGFWIRNKLYRFTTYTGARLEKCRVEKGVVELELSDAHYLLKVSAIRSDGGELVSPVQGLMAGRVNETMSARIQVRLSRLSGELIFEGEGRNAGLEVAGPYQELLSS